MYRDSERIMGILIMQGLPGPQRYPNTWSLGPLCGYLGSIEYPIEVTWRDPGMYHPSAGTCQDCQDRMPLVLSEV